MNPTIPRDRKTLTVNTHGGQLAATYSDIAIGPSEVDARCFYVKDGCLFIDVDQTQRVYAPGYWDFIDWK